MDILALARKRLEHLRNARLPRAEIQRRQLVKFRKLVAHAVARSPYYRDIVKERGIDVARCTPGDFPVLTKALVMEHFDRIVTDPAITRKGLDEFFRTHKITDRFLDKYYAVRSSGTSGEPGVFMYSPSDWSRGAAQALRVNPPVFRRRNLAFIGSSGSVGVALMSSTKKWPMRHLFNADSFNINVPLTELCERVQKFAPDILMGYPSAIAILAERQLAGALKIAPSVVQTTAEMLTPATRALIQEGFGVPVRNFYACTEHLIIGFAHPDFDGMYLFEDDLIFELAADHTVVTNLFNYTQPLIRYRMNDVLIPKSDEIGTYPFLKVGEIVGRKEATAIFTNRHGVDDFISPSMIATIGVKNMRRFQLALRGKTACTVRVALAPGLDAAARDAAFEEIRIGFQGILRHKEMDNVAVEVEERNDLAPDARTGKYNYVVSA